MANLNTSTTTAKQDLAVYRSIKQVKTDFNSEYKKIGLNIKKSNFSEAKGNITKCEGYISEIEKLVDKLPDRSKADDAKALVISLIGCLSIIAAAPAFYIINRAQISHDKDKEEKLKSKKFAQDINTDVSLKKMLHAGKKKLDDGISQKDLEDLDKLEKSYLSDFGKEWNKKNKVNKEYSNQINKSMIHKTDERNIDKLSSDATYVAGTASFLALISLKPLKTKAKTVLKNCRKKLDKTKAYIDKVEKMSKAVKESFDETLDDLYESFTEGTIDEFEYDTLIDQLLD